MKIVKFILAAILIINEIMLSHCWFSDYMKCVDNYSLIIEYNWDVKLPTNYQNSFDFNDESIYGEGIRYNILEYDDEVELNECLEWSQNADPTIIDLVNATIKAKNIDKKYSLKRERNYKFFSKSGDEDSKLYIFFDEELNTIYVLENIR